MLSASPVKGGPRYWLPQLGLFESDKEVIESYQWLNDNIIRGAQSVLKQQCQGKIDGWMNTQLTKRKKLFNPIHPSTDFVQVLHVSESHWLTVSNISLAKTKDRILVYDSSLPTSLKLPTKKAICSIVKPATDIFNFDIVDVQRQPNLVDCGVFALAFATEIVHGCSPARAYFDVTQLRPHLVKCLEAGHFTRFPLVKERRVPLGCLLKCSIQERIYCTCRTVNDVDLAMVECDSCHRWYHENCEKVTVEEVRDIKWSCSVCKNVFGTPSC